MSKMRNVMTFLLGLAALAVLALVIVWLYRAQAAIPSGQATGPQVAAAPPATPTIPAEIEFVTPVPPEEVSEPTPTVPVQFESPLARPTPEEALPEPVLEVQPVAAEALSDDTIAFLREGDLHLVNASSRATTQVSVSGNVAYLFGWSHDRTKLLVGVGEYPVILGSDMPRGTDLWVMDVQVGKVTQLTQGLGVHPIYGVAWSPVSHQIAYVTRDWDLYVVNSDGSDRQQLLDGHAGGWPSWSPDGSELAYSHMEEAGNWEVMNITVLTLTDGALRRLTAIEDASAYPVWSLDAKEVLFQSPMAGPGTGTWFVVNADGGNLRHLLESPSSIASNPDRSPSADQLAFNLYGEVLIMDFEGHVQRVAEGIKPSWSPDGHMIAFIDGDGGVSVVNADGSGLAKLTTEGTEPHWSYRQEAGGGRDG